ncbi:hypothetical protein FF80_00599 [Devosia sp. LC5]|nr:hypothetical protein FF80_00599 [Devosia sp. LC5]
MPAAKHQRSGAIKGIEQIEPLRARHIGQQRQPNQQHCKQHQHRRAKPFADAKRGRRMRRHHFAPTPRQPRQNAQPNRRHLPGRTRDQHGQSQSHHRNGRTLPVRRQAPRHAPHRLRHHGNRDDLEPMQHTLRHRPFQRARPQGEQHQQDRRWQGKGRPGRQRTERSATPQPQRKADLARCRPRQELAQRYKIAIALLVDPAAAGNQFIAKIAEMGNRPAERGQTELQKCQKNFAGIALTGWCHFAHAGPIWQAALFGQHDFPVDHLGLVT